MIVRLGELKTLVVLPVAGQVTARLFASTTGTDSDWVVKLIDVYPQKVEKDPGYALLYRSPHRRPRLQEGSSHHGAGTKHLVPLVRSRNPQKFVPNIFDAKASDCQAATQKIYRSAKYPSSVEVQIVPNGAGH
jgi:uncharacterized protein